MKKTSLVLTNSGNKTTIRIIDKKTGRTLAEHRIPKKELRSWVKALAVYM